MRRIRAARLVSVLLGAALLGAACAERADGVPAVLDTSILTADGDVQLVGGRLRTLTWEPGAPVPPGEPGADRPTGDGDTGRVDDSDSDTDSDSDRRGRGRKKGRGRG